MSLSISLSLSSIYLFSSSSSFYFFLFSFSLLLFYIDARPFTRQRPFGGRGHGHSGAPQTLFSSFFSFSCFSPHHFSMCNLPIAGEKRKKKREEEEEKNTFTVSINVFKRTRATTVCEEEEGRIENQPQKESPKRKKLREDQTREKGPVQVDTAAQSNHHQHYSSFFFFFFWVEGYFICSASFSICA